jgi:glycosyltransferase involved in cell wall biosynthesis
MPELYRTANVFAHGALTEMMPIALLETLASGVPIVANTFPIFEWILGKGGITVDLTKHGGMASTLGSLIDQPARLAELSKAARAQVLANFETTRVVDQLLDMYRRVLEP